MTWWCVILSREEKEELGAVGAVHAMQPTVLSTSYVTEDELIKSNPLLQDGSAT
jgi:hypothetical protein